MTDDAPKIITPAGEAHFVNLLIAKVSELNPDKGPMFNLTLVFDKAAQATPEFARMRQAVKDAIVEKWGDKVPSTLRTPFRPSEEKADKGFPPGCLFITLSTKLKPEVVDAEGQDIFEGSQLYTGMLGRASLSIYAYDKGGNRGVSFGLNNFQKLADGERKFSGKSSAASDFGTVSKEDSNVDLDALLSA